MNSIHPGGVNTIMGNPMGSSLEELDPYWRHRVALGRIGEPIDIANMALFLASDEAGYCTGAEFVVDGGWTCGDIEPLLPGAPDWG